MFQTSVSFYRKLGRFPFDEKVWLEFLEISTGEWNSIFRNFRSIWFSSGNFCNFRLNGSLFGNSSISGFSGNFPRKFPFQNFGNFWFNGKAPLDSPCLRPTKYKWNFIYPVVIKENLLFIFVNYHFFFLSSKAFVPASLRAWARILYFFNFLIALTFAVRYIYNN